ncbi:MAG: 2-hydroxyacyl-CoA dehydratase, partial [Sphingomonadales bacterium]
DWWAKLGREWETMLDADRLDYREAAERDLVARVEKLTGKRLEDGALATAMAKINAQMELWGEAQKLIADAPKCPVHIRDQISIYQAMWHRGTDKGVELIRDYRDEIAERIEQGIGAYENERFRLYYSVQVPPWHAAIEEQFGAVAVCSSYANIPELYWRQFDPANPLRALAARHMMLFDWGPYRIIDVASRHRCDAAIVVEQAMANGPSRQQEIVEAAGIPYCAVPRGADDSEVRGIIADFIQTRLC